jgi:chromosome segregation ATPase
MTMNIADILAIIIPLGALMGWYHKRIDQRFKDLIMHLEHRFDKIDEKFDKIDERTDARFDKMDLRFNKIDERFKDVDGKFDNLQQSITSINLRLTKMEGRFEEKAKITTNKNRIREKIWIHFHQWHLQFLILF